MPPISPRTPIMVRQIQKHVVIILRLNLSMVTEIENVLRKFKFKGINSILSHQRNRSCQKHAMYM